MYGVQLYFLHYLKMLNTTVVEFPWKSLVIQFSCIEAVSKIVVT